MVITCGWIVLWLLVGLAAMQSIYVWLHCRFLQSSVKAECDESWAPKVAVVLCVRGSDPSLPKCLAGLVQQEFEHYEIHVVADDREDPALRTVQEFFATQELDPPTIHVLSEHAKSRSLKCSAIIAAISELDDSIEVVALIDADTVVDPNWLKDLVQPLGDPAVGATTGNRWFAPATSNLASNVRQAWNAAAVAQITLYQIPWGGSLALKRSTIDRCELLKHWSNAFCEDTMLTNILQKNNLRMVRVPALVLVNDESTTMASTFEWIVRQLLTVRLYHRDWPLVLAHGLLSSVCLSAAPIIIAWLFLSSEPRLGLLVLVVLCLFEINNAVLLIVLQAANRRVVDQRSSATHDSRGAGAGMLAILVTQLLYPVAVLVAATAKRVSWRGIDYSIGPGKRITMLEYHRYCELDDEDLETGTSGRSIE